MKNGWRTRVDWTGQRAAKEVKRGLGLEAGRKWELDGALEVLVPFFSLLNATVALLG